jgi:hypothetical protein
MIERFERYIMYITNIVSVEKKKKIESERQLIKHRLNDG